MANGLPSYSEIRKRKAQAAEADLQKPAEESRAEEAAAARDYINSFSSTNKDKRVAFRIQSDIYNQFARLCAKEGATVSFKIGKLIRDEIERQSKK